jgi:Cofilin/tropomyosin-type actin-binding protein
MMLIAVTVALTTLLHCIIHVYHYMQVFFIYSCPESALVRLKMTYSTARASVLAAVTEIVTVPIKVHYEQPLNYLILVQ